MNTNDYIKNLAKDLNPDENRLFFMGAFLTWAIGTAGLLTFSYWFFPFRADLNPRLSSMVFTIETALYFALFLAAAYVAYRSSIPGLLQMRERRIGQILVVALIVILISKLSFSNFQEQLLGEMDFYRGRCGPLIFILGALESALALVIARRTAPTNLARTGAWLALSAGALGLFVMQFVCTFENFMHLLIWHAVPVGLLVGAGVLASRRFLRW